MPMVEPTYVFWLIGAIVAAAAVFTCLGYLVARRRRRRARTSFALGVLCGVVAGPALRRRSRALRVLDRLTGRPAPPDRFATRALALVVRRGTGWPGTSATGFAGTGRRSPKPATGSAPVSPRTPRPKGRGTALMAGRT